MTYLDKMKKIWENFHESQKFSPSYQGVEYPLSKLLKTFGFVGRVTMRKIIPDSQLVISN